MLAVFTKSVRDMRSAAGTSSRKRWFGMPSFSQFLAAFSLRTTSNSTSEMSRFSTFSRSAINTGAPSFCWAFSSRSVPMNATCPAGASLTNRRYVPLPTIVRHEPSPSSRRWPFSVYFTPRASDASFGSCLMKASRKRSTVCSRQARSHVEFCANAGEVAARTRNASKVVFIRAFAYARDPGCSRCTRTLPHARPSACAGWRLSPTVW